MSERARRAQIKRELDAQIKEGNGIFVTVALHRERMFMMEQRKRSELALGAYLRRAEGWNLNSPTSERDAIAARVRDMLAKGVDEDHEYHGVIQASRRGNEVFTAQEKEATWKLEYMAEKFPVWDSWAANITGFGARSLGVIIGEAGDLSKYSTHYKLWKRMGLAVIDGVRQGGLPKGAPAEAWISHGYNAQRRSHAHVIGECLMKCQNPYRDVYLERKEYERMRAEENGLIVAPAAKIPASKKDEYMSEGHIHNRALRYMEKRLLRDLWKAWRRAKPCVEDIEETLPAVEVRAA